MKQLYLYVSSSGNEWLVWDVTAGDINDSGTLNLAPPKPDPEDQIQPSNHTILDLNLDKLSPEIRRLPCIIILSGQYIREFNFDLMGGKNKSQSAALLEINQELSQTADELYISNHNAQRQHWSMKVISKTLINELLGKTNASNISLQGIMADYDLLPLKGSRTLMRTDNGLLIRQATEISTSSDDSNACKDCRSASVHNSFLPFWLTEESARLSNQGSDTILLGQHWLNDKTTIENDLDLRAALRPTDTFDANLDGKLLIEKLVNAFYATTENQKSNLPLHASPLNSWTQLLTPSALQGANIDPTLSASVSNTYSISSPPKIIFWFLVIGALTAFGLEYL